VSAPLNLIEEYSSVRWFSRMERPGFTSAASDLLGRAERNRYCDRNRERTGSGQPIVKFPRARWQPGRFTRRFSRRLERIAAKRHSPVVLIDNRPETIKKPVSAVARLSRFPKQELPGPEQSRALYAQMASTG